MNEAGTRLMDLRCREVINVRDGTRYGFVCDAVVDYTTGRIQSIVIPGTARLMGFIGRREDIVIPWEAITRIGDDIILVDWNPILPRKEKAPTS
ncbi:MAG: YlmC/YmxH family sporulation protein [Clostridia bacterium]|nr:YlmC/YmxH family sporulation protein [Clostridia bacterium]MBR6764201.1 YlmC/YmxH family sporulation protein [Clostridia bacterium]